MKQRYLIQLSYLGTNYHGWQRQPDVPTVQATIEDQLSILQGEKVNVHGCGRTDRGVHASNYLAHADLETADVLTINTTDIKVHQVIEVPRSFHAQHDALSRTYCYLVGLPGLLIEDDLMGRFYQKYDLDLLQSCARRAVGVHDFAGLCRTPNKFLHTMCNVESAQWESMRDGKVLRFMITANRFLPQMVRIMVAAMLQVASTRMLMKEWDDLLTGTSTWGSRAGAYSNGLYFVGASYGDISLSSDVEAPFFVPVRPLLIDPVR